ncbi:MAG: substrate-binding domain-containing protein [Planctomycetaceae bacterium]|nr:substrate-binding domain-containing protein [Planctomycetaceae bacterium]
MRRIALVIDLDWPVRHHQGMAQGVLRHARERDWACDLEPFLGSRGTGSVRYDGVIGRVTRPLAAWAARTRTPVVNVWINSPDRTLPRVIPDLAAAGALAARHFLERGLRSLAFLGPEHDAAARGMLAGFRAEAERARVPVDVRVAPSDPRQEAGWHRLQQWIRRWVSRWTAPLGVFASLDLHARYLCDAAARERLRIPEDVAILGAGNTSLLCDLMEPALSSLEFGFERVGRGAAELLERLMKGRRPPRGPVLVPPTGIVSRRSSDMFAVDDPVVSAALRSIWTRSVRPVGVRAVLEDVPTSRRTLERRFREALGRTLHDEIRRAHVERSKRLLVESREPLKVVAARSGFRDAPQFSRVFRASEGLTPQEYRDRHSEP